jgi:hypothetical protein
MKIDARSIENLFMNMVFKKKIKRHFFMPLYLKNIEQILS